ncbi:sensor histidine kinase [Paenibacillus psychroresistens]|uniref:sensor histidine kinase n=1 Tax=Paenibacillus psychroresistens TaxID=1778678 RepID=UPI001390F2A7|nr:histidine kinase [Paenibacillus psychroresistens]
MGNLRIWRTSIFVKLIIAFIIATLPIYALAGFLYSWGTTVVKQDITESAQSQSSNYILALEDSLKRFSLMQYEMFSDTFLVELINTTETIEAYRQIELILNIRARLFSIKNSSGLIKDVRIFMPRLNIEISALSGYGSLALDKVVSDKLKSPFQLIYYQQKLLMVAYPLDQSSTESPEMIVEIEISQEALNKELVDSIKRNYSGAIVLNISNQLQLGEIIKPVQQEWIDQRQLVNKHSDIPEEMKMNGESFLIIHSKAQAYSITLDHYILKDQIFKKVNKNIQWFWLFFIITFGVIGLYLTFINRTIHRPFVKIMRAFKRVEEGNLELNIRHEKNDEFQYLYDRFNSMLLNIHSLIEQVYKQKIFLQNAELKQLQSQINPHFLYNCLFSITRMIKMDKSEQAIQFAEQLAQYFQFITKNSQDMVTLENEVIHARNYAVLQLARFSDRISIDFSEVPDEIKNFKVPRLILQPLIENAFIHGLEDKLHSGVLRVFFELNADMISITVEDNGEEGAEHLEKMNVLLSDKQPDQEVTAILNVHRRLQYKYGEISGLTVTMSKLGGIKVNMNIQKEDENNV